VADNKAPAYQWYVNDARSDRVFQRMTWAQKGMYREMLDEQWDNGGNGLPDDPRACAELLGGPEAEWVANWPMLRRKFVDRRARPRDRETAIPTDHDASRRIINLRLEKQRTAQKKFRLGQREAGRKGGLSKAAKAKDLQASEPTGSLEGRYRVASENPSEPVAPAVANSSSSLHSTASAFALASSTATGTRDRPKRANGHQAHRYCGVNFCVSQIQHDKFWQELGPQREVFDLDDAYRRYDAENVAIDNLLPWLKARINRDAGIASSSPAASGKTAGNLGNLQRFAAKVQA